MRGEGRSRWQPVDRGNKRGDQGKRREVRRAPRGNADTSSGDNPLSALEAWSQRQSAQEAGRVQNPTSAPKRGERRVPPRLRGQRQDSQSQDQFTDDRGGYGIEQFRAKRAAEEAQRAADEQRRAKRTQGLRSYSRPSRERSEQERPSSRRIERAPARQEQRGPSREQRRQQEVQRRRDISEARNLIDRQKGYKQTAEQAMYPLQQRLAAERDLQRRKGLERLIYARQKIVEESNRQIQEQEDRLRQLGAA